MIKKLFSKNNIIPPSPWRPRGGEGKEKGKGKGKKKIKENGKEKG